MSKSENQTVAQLRGIAVGEKQPFGGIFLLRKAAVKKAKNGNDFLSLEFGDRTGSFQANCWGDSPAYPALSQAKEGDIVRIGGVSDHYRDAFSPNLRAAQVLDEKEAEELGALDGLLKVSPEDPEALWDEFSRLTDGMANEGLRLTVRAVMEECQGAFRTAPAAVSMHQAYRFGLLEHTVHVARVGKALLPLYPEVEPSLAMAGCLLHDIGKVIEYAGGLVQTRTRQGRLLGHVVLGYKLVRSAALRVQKKFPEKINADTIERLEHIVLSHQGELEWGAAVLACTPEALFVSLADNFDAKMSMAQEALRDAPQGTELSEFMKGLGVQLLLTRPVLADGAEAKEQQENLL